MRLPRLLPLSILHLFSVQPLLSGKVPPALAVLVDLLLLRFFQFSVFESLADRRCLDLPQSLRPAVTPLQGLRRTQGLLLPRPLRQKSKTMQPQAPLELKLSSLASTRRRSTTRVGITGIATILFAGSCSRTATISLRNIEHASSRKSKGSH